MDNKHESSVSSAKTAKKYIHVAGKSFGGNISTISNFNVGAGMTCQFCDKADHKSAYCTEYKTQSQRKAIITKNRRCFNCFGKHFICNCPKPNYCKKCGSRHHTLICGAEFSQKVKLNSQNSQSMNYKTNKSTETSQSNGEVKSGETRKSNGSTIVAAVASNQSETNIVLPTAILAIQTNNGTEHERALFDQGSQRSFISSRLYNRLQLDPIKHVNLVLNAFGTKGCSQRYPIVRLVVAVLDRLIELELLVIDRFPQSIETPDFALHARYLQTKVQLADPNIISDNVPISILIGGDYYFRFVRQYFYKYHTNLLETPLGFMISGPIPSPGEQGKESSEQISVLTYGARENLEDSVAKLWDIESIGIQPMSSKEEDVDAMVRFHDDIHFEDGKYVTRLPWKAEKPLLPSNYGLAVGRLHSILRKLRAHPQNLEQYAAALRDYLHNDFVEEVDDPFAPCSHSVHYIPHLPVWKADSATTPLRIVFDASAGSTSLNDCLISGPSLNNELVGVMLRFRLNKYACIGDISKAYLRIGLHPED